MKNVFVQTHNAKNFIEPMKDAVRAQSDSALLVFHGQAGRGKTTAARFFAAQEGWAYCRAKTLWTELWMLQDLCFDLGVDPDEIPKRKKPAFEAIVEDLTDNQRPVIVDEADKMTPKVLEVIRDLADLTMVPWALVGEKLLMIKMQRERRIWSRTVRAVEFGPISTQDILFFAQQATGMKLTAGQGEMFREASEGDFRLVARDIGRLEAIMQASGHEDVKDDTVHLAIKQGLRGSA